MAKFSIDEALNANLDALESGFGTAGQTYAGYSDQQKLDLLRNATRGGGGWSLSGPGEVKVADSSLASNFSDGLFGLGDVLPVLATFAGLAFGAQALSTGLSGALAGTGGTVVADSAVGTSFSDILASQFTPQNMITSALKSTAVSAITGRPISPEGIAAGVLSGGLGGAVSGAVGGGVVGSVAGAVTSAGTGAALGGLMGNSAPPPASTPAIPVTPGATQSNPNGVPTSFALTLSPFQPQFKRNT